MTNQRKVLETARVMLANNPVAMAYLKEERRLTSEIIERYGLGFLPPVLPPGLPTRMEVAGLTVSSNRIVMPSWYNKKLVMVSSRSLDENPRFKHMHLYWNGTYVPYGVNEVYLEFDDSPIYVVESPICCMTLAQSGFPAIAVYGQSFSRNMGEFIGKHYKGRAIILVADNDAAGLDGFNRLGKTIIPFNPNVYLAHMHHNKDVNDAYRECRESFRSTFPAQIADSSVKVVPDPPQPKPSKASKPKDTSLQDLKDRISILEVASMLGMRVPGGARDSKIYTQCPIHKDTSPSFVIYPRTNSFNCFGACNTGGDQLTLIQFVKNCDFKTAVEWFRSTFT